MSENKSYWLTAVLLLVLALVTLGFKFYNNSILIDDLVPKEMYSVTLEFDLTDLPERTQFASYLPISNIRQHLSPFESVGDSVNLRLEKDDYGLKAFWEVYNKPNLLSGLRYEVECKAIEFHIPIDARIRTSFGTKSVQNFLRPEEHIQSDHPIIDSLAKDLKKATFRATLHANFAFVQDITNSYTRTLTDAVKVLELNRASCNGKSRLFTALCRAQGIPARVAGGIILENGRKRTSHLWSEVYFDGNWIPFDVLNNHFARLPANYLELYKGDKFLFSHNKILNFDFQFDIRKTYRSQLATKYNGPQLWALLHEFQISENLLRTIILLPLAALLIAIFRNVIGLKTFGILLPALIGLALVNVHAWIGLTALAMAIIVVSLLHKLLEKWALLHVPKVVIMLTSVIIALLFFGILGPTMGWDNAEMMIYLPIVVVSLTAERFAKILIEEQLSEALRILGNTIFVALISCLIFRSGILLGLFLSFPELYLIILFVTLLLGRWIGMRVLEYKRFAPVKL